MSSPKVSVCIPTYNYGRYLAEAVESVLAQTFRDYELLVIDDCSTDETDEVMRGFAERDERIRYIRNAENLGMVENWNLCLRQARGEYIKYLFGDDLLSSKCAIEKMAAALDADPSISLVGSARNIIDENSNPIKIRSFPSKDGVLEGGKVIFLCLTHLVNYIGEPSAVMFRKLQGVRGFNCKYRQRVDLEMWFHLLEQGRYAFINDPLCAFRLHGEQQTVKNARYLVSLDDTRNLLRDYLDKPYIRLGKFARGYLYFDYVYKIWKSYRKKGLITKEEAVQRIAKEYGIARFFLLLPLYMSYKPFLKLGRCLSRGVPGRETMK
jgi:glycosyltransferase involved in cell wall biosynthesis